MNRQSRLTTHGTLSEACVPTLPVTDGALFIKPIEIQQLHIHHYMYYCATTCRATCKLGQAQMKHPHPHKRTYVHIHTYVHTGETSENKHLLNRTYPNQKDSLVCMHTVNFNESTTTSSAKPYNPPQFPSTSMIEITNIGTNEYPVNRPFF